ncbi:LOW QUALITY PROTEIN: Isopenicillin N synthase-like, Fe(2+) 2OG dioxygenase domain, partial [Dillenia turbinata]
MLFMVFAVITLQAFNALKLEDFYYPICPDPSLNSLGMGKHTDPHFLTILLQDNVGGLQVLHQDHWVDVFPLEGALMVNMGDFIQ